MERCRLERCKTLKSVFVEEEIIFEQQLKSLYLCSLSSLERICSQRLQSGIFSSLKHLHLDCCLELVNIFSPLMCPVNLESLEVKFSVKLKSLFEGDGSAECELPKLKTLELFDLPLQGRIGALMPAWETLKVKMWDDLHDLCSGTSKSNVFSSLNSTSGQLLEACEYIFPIAAPWKSHVC